MSLAELKNKLVEAASEDRAQSVQRFFKTEAGAYAQNDVFIGVPVPLQRKIAAPYLRLPTDDLQELLHDEIHEFRSVALIILLKRYERAVRKPEKEAVVRFYLQHIDRVNNWDLVDMSADKILGRYAFKDRSYMETIRELADDFSIWKNRVAIVSTLYFIKQGETALTEELAKKFLYHTHDLIHKATGWALRELGKKSPEDLKRFIAQHHEKMPRTTLRYAIERWDKKTRDRYVKPMR